MAVVIPTYNEAGNIGRLIDELVSHVAPMIRDWRMAIVVVDDSSPDGTGRIVSEKVAQYADHDSGPNHADKVAIHLITQPEKSGIGAAYLRGFTFALNDLRADAVFEFDADFQHPPETIVAMLNKLDQGYDYIIGSRKMKGGGESANRNFSRSLLTGLGGFLARMILFFPSQQFRQVTDPTTGLKLTRVKNCLERLNLDPKHLHSKKFGYKVQLLSETLALGARYAEVPLHFGERMHGESKMELNTAFDILRACLSTRLNDKTSRRFLKFATVGFSGYVVNAIALQSFSGFVAIEPLSWALATEVAIISNFLFNNAWTFADGRISGGARLVTKFLQFNTVSAGAIIIQAIFGSLGVYIFGPSYRQIILPIIIVLLVMPYNWLAYNMLVWRKRAVSC